MTKLPALTRQLRELQAEANHLKDQGMILEDAWIASYSPSNSDRLYKQLRSRSLLPNGKKAMHLRDEQVGEYQAAIERGRQLKRLNREMSKLQKQVDRIAAIAAETGLELPTSCECGVSSSIDFAQANR